MGGSGMRLPKILKHKAAKAKWKQMQRTHKLTGEVEIELCVQLCLQVGILSSAQESVEIDGIVVRSPTNGAPYRNPALDVRHKSLEIISKLEKKLAPYKIDAADELEV